MANVDRPNGAVPVGTLSGGPFTAAIRAYDCDASAGNIFPGDFVILEADGKVAPATAGAVELIGVCVGVLPWMPAKVNGVTAHNISTSSLDLMKKYHVTGAAGTILVAVGPDVLYEMQEDGAVSQLAATDVGNNVDILATAGSTTTGLSLQEIDSDTVTAATAQLRLVEFVDRPDNEIGAVAARWIVRINENHFTKLAGI